MTTPHVRARHRGSRPRRTERPVVAEERRVADRHRHGQQRGRTPADDQERGIDVGHRTEGARGQHTAEFERPPGSPYGGQQRRRRCGRAFARHLNLHDQVGPRELTRWVIQETAQNRRRDAERQAGDNAKWTRWERPAQPIVMDDVEAVELVAETPLPESRGPQRVNLDAEDRRASPRARDAERA